MRYEKFKELSRTSWGENYKDPCIDRSKKRDRGRFCVSKKNKNTYREYIPETKPF